MNPLGALRRRWRERTTGPDAAPPATPEALVERAIRQGRSPTPELVRDLLAERLVVAGDLGARDLLGEWQAELFGLGPLQRFIADTRVTDVLVNPDGQVFVDRGGGVEATGSTLPPARAEALAVRLATLAGRRLDAAHPWVDGDLPGGIRLHAVLSPLAEGPTLSLRCARHQPRGIRGLEDLGAVGPAMAGALRDLIRARVSFVVSGGTGSGKTTVLGGLLSECGPAERIVLVEDVRELAPAHPHVVRLQGRAPNVEGVGAVTLVDLVRQALRMRPDRLVVGEVRGAEVRELLAALNTGHRGGAGTVHANGAQEVPARLAALGALAGLGREALHAQVTGAIEVVVHCTRAGPRRFVESVSVLVEGADGPRVLPALTAVPGVPAASVASVAGAGRDDGVEVGEAWPLWQSLVGRAEGRLGRAA